MKVRRGALYLADLSPRLGTEPGKVRPVLVIQTDLLNEAEHPSTWVIPCTTRTSGEVCYGFRCPGGVAGNRQDCEVMIDQVARSTTAGSCASCVCYLGGSCVRSRRSCVYWPISEHHRRCRLSRPPRASHFLTVCIAPTPATAC